MLNSFKFNDAKCKITCGLALGRIKLIKNKRNLQIKQYRKEIAELLRTGRQDYARIRVEAIIRESLTLTALEVLELYLELLNVRAPLVTKSKEIPRDMVEAISSIIYAASRLADLPELTTLHKMFAVKYGKEYVTEAASDVTCGRWMVNENLRRCLTVEPPEPALKLEALSDIAQEFNVEWDLDRARRELMPETAGVSGFGGGGFGGYGGGGAVYTDAAGATANAHAAYAEPGGTGRNQGGGGGGGAGSPFVSAHLPMSPLPQQQQQQQQQQQGGQRAYTDAHSAAAAAAAAAADARRAADYAARFAGSNGGGTSAGTAQPPSQPPQLRDGAGAGAPTGSQGFPGPRGPPGGLGEFGGDGAPAGPPIGWLGGPGVAGGAPPGSPGAPFVPRSEEDIRRAYDAAPGPPAKPNSSSSSAAAGAAAPGPAAGAGAAVPAGPAPTNSNSDGAGVPPSAPPAAGGDSEFDELQKRFDALKRGGL